MGPWGIFFGLFSAAVFVIAAFFSTRANRSVAAFMFVMWVATKVWNYKTGTDAQIYLDTALACLCGLLCVFAMRWERRAIWPLIILGIMVVWVILNAAFADVRDDMAQFNDWHQLASNVLYGIALIAGAVPGGRRGALVVRRAMLGHSCRRPRPSLGSGWGREDPNAISKRKVRTR